MESDQQLLVKKVKDFFSRVTYKPGSSFVPFEDLNGVGFRFQLQVVDMEVPTHKSMIARGGLIRFRDLNLHKADLDGFLKHEVRRIVHSGEIHEADEWFKVDGVAPFDPHKGGR